MRLKQITLNLASNAAKFVNEGYICLCAEVINGSVVVSVSDTGPGIPPAKRKNLFSKYQESLDALSQGTGKHISLYDLVRKWN
jgi:signal transduction histidine kinase